MKRVRQKGNEPGFILVTVLLMIVALSLIGITGMVISSNEVMIAGYINKSKEAFYVSEAALEEAKNMILNDYMKGKATAVAADKLTDTSQLWDDSALVGMHLVDNGGNIYEITGNNATELDLDADMNSPLEGSYHIVFSNLDRGAAGTNGVSGAPGFPNDFIVATANWPVVPLPDYWWEDCGLLVSGTGTMYDIESSTLNTLTTDGTPPDGNWEIICNRYDSGTDSMFVYDDTYTVPSYVTNSSSGNMNGWILIDSQQNRFNIADSGVGFISNTIVITSGNPADGSFVVTRPGWIHDDDSPLYGGGGDDSTTWEKTYDIGGNPIGKASVLIERNDTTRGSYTITSTGSIAKANKSMQVTLTDTGNGDANFYDWHETASP